MAKQYTLGSNVVLDVDPSRTDVVILKRGVNNLHLDIDEWKDLYSHHERIDEEIHLKFRERYAEDECKCKHYETADSLNRAYVNFLFLKLSYWLNTVQFTKIVESVLDGKFNASPLGARGKRVCLLRNNIYTRLDFYNYEKFVATNSNGYLNYYEWIDLLKCIDDVNELVFPRESN